MNKKLTYILIVLKWLACTPPKTHFYKILTHKKYKLYLWIVLNIIIPLKFYFYTKKKKVLSCCSENFPNRGRGLNPINWLYSKTLDFSSFHVLMRIASISYRYSRVSTEYKSFVPLLYTTLYSINHTLLCNFFFFFSFLTPIIL